MKNYRRLFRSRSERVLGGVCGGVANYFEIDPVIIRFLFIIAVLLGGWVLLAYIGAWIIIPKEPKKVATEPEPSTGTQG